MRPAKRSQISIDAQNPTNRSPVRFIQICYHEFMTTRHSIAKSFGFAFEGLKEAIINGRNFRIQLFFGVVASVLGYFLKITEIEWLMLILTISFVLILELVNTSLESIVDLVSPEIRDSAKIAKDVSAAAVLIASITSIVIGAIIFLPKILVGVQ